MSNYEHHKKDCCCGTTINNTNNNNIVVPPVIINGGAAQGKLIDFVFFTATPQDVFNNPVQISSNVNNPTIVAQLTVNNIKAGDRIWLNGLFHVNNNEVNIVAFADTRIYINAVVPGQEIYRTVVEIDREPRDDFAQIINVQDVETFSVDTNSITYIFVVSVQPEVDQAFLQKPITGTASLIR